MSIDECDTVQYIREHCTIKQCKRFVSSDDDNSDVGHCTVCNGAEDVHLDETLYDQNCGPWNFVQSNAYGEITFYPSTFGYRKPAKYVRFSDDTNVAVISELMLRHWQLTMYTGRPDLIISLNGGNSRRAMTTGVTEAFECGLLKTIKTTGAWVLTNGINIGIAKQLGNVSREYQALEWHDKAGIIDVISRIAITPWSALSKRHRSELLNAEPNKLHHAKLVDVSQLLKNGYVALNPDHTHFLLVDNGVMNTQHNAFIFRARMERHINTPENDGGMGIAVISILFDGDISSLYQVVESLNRGVPLLICDNSGGAANVFARIVHTYSHGKSQKTFDVTEFLRLGEQQLSELLTVAVEDEIPAGDVLANRILTALERHFDLVSIFRAERRNDVDIAIIESLMHAKRMDIMSQLRLTLKWDRADIAKQKVINADDMGLRSTNDNLCALLDDALKTNKPDFVRLFIEQGILIDQFLTCSRLIALYDSIAIEYRHVALLFNRSDDDTRPITLYDVGLLLKKMVGRFSNITYENLSKLNNVENVEHATSVGTPYHELFLWAIIANRQEMALLFWEYLDDPLIGGWGGALIARNISKKLDMQDDIQQRYLEFASDLEELAVGVINQAYVTKPEKAILLLHAPAKMYGNLNCLQLARLSKAQSFLSTKCCQETVLRHWKGDMDLTVWETIFGMLFVFPILCNNKTRLNKDVQTNCCGRQRTISAHGVANNLGNVLDLHLNINKVQGNQTRYRSGLHKKPAAKLLGTEPASSVKHRQPFRHNVDSPHRRIIRFYNAPIVKFATHSGWYLVYLLLYSYTLLFAFKIDQPVSWQEILLYLWQLSFLLETIRMVLSMPAESVIERIRDLTHKFTLQMDAFAIFLSIFVFILRWSTDTFPFARLIMCIALSPYFMQIFKLHMSNSYLGPKIMMIQRMCWDLLLFLSVIVVFFAAYTITSTALLHSDYDKFYWGIFWDLYNFGIWDIFGQINEEAMTGAISNCTLFSWDGNFTLDCALRKFPVPLLLTSYLLFANILLINMLIAIFAHVFDDVQLNAEKIWKYQIYYLLEEYRSKPLIPAPFILFVHVYRAVRWILCGHWYYAPMKRAPEPVVVFGQEITEQEQISLQIFERLCRADFVEDRRRIERKRMRNIIIQLKNDVTKLVDAIQDDERCSDEMSKLSVFLKTQRSMEHEQGIADDDCEIHSHT